MNLFGKEVPCGCDERKEIMFTQGDLGLQEALIVGIPLAVLIFLIVKGKLNG